MRVFTYLYIGENFLKKFLKEYSQIEFRQKTSELESSPPSSFCSYPLQPCVPLPPDNTTFQDRSDNVETGITAETIHPKVPDKTSDN